MDSKKNNNLETRIEKYAKSFLGTPYVWGATGADSFDSSGFTKWIYKDIGIVLPRVSREQAKIGKYIRYENLQTGDLVFFDFSKNGRGRVQHVGIYLNNGNFIHASSAKKKVIITNINQDNYYKKGFLWGRRVVEEKINTKKGSFNVYSNLGDVYVGNKEYDKAIEAYYKALDINSNKNDLYLNIFEAQLIKGISFDEKIERDYINKFGKKKEDMISFDMLKILQNIVNNQKVTIKDWEKKYSNVQLNYIFDDLALWAKTRKNKKILNMLEIFKEHNKILRKKELYVKMKKKHVLFSKQGWVYLGEFEKGKWIKKYFGFNYDTNPLELINTQQTMTSPILSIREFGYATKIIGKLDKNDKVKILSVKSVSHMVENEGFMWAKVKY
jgi:tetratricopeptide (TPR) repeat protein